MTKPAPRRQILDALRPAVLLGRYRNWRSERLERPHLLEFQRFYETLEDKRDVFWIFFTSDLLHWLVKVLEHAPPGVNIALLGSDLGDDEVEWIRSEVDRPFHHVRERVDDKTAWEFLFRTNRHNFGWIDVDCVITNPELYREMADIADDVCINSVWSYSALGGLDVLCTHFLFLNCDVLRSIEARGIPVSPCTYNYEGSPFGRGEGVMEGRLRRAAVSKIPHRRHVELLREILPLDDRGRPAFPSSVVGYPAFDTLVLYQMVANALGYRLHNVRRIDGLYEGSPQFYFADHDFRELVHPGGASWFRQLHCDPEARERYLMLSQANLLLLGEVADRLPERYRRARRDLAAELEGFGVALEDARRLVFSYMTSKGASLEVCRNLFGAGEEAAVTAAPGGARA